MPMLKIGVIREGKQPPDFRVPLTPKACKEIVDAHDNVEIVVQSSADRCYRDEEYQRLGISIVDKLDDCDVLLGVKEVPIQDLIDNKTYFFFSHTIKKQPYNKGLLKALLQANIRMIDYETLVDEKGKRIIGFGYFAGVVGAHNALLTYGKKYNKYSLAPAYELHDLENLKAQYANIDFPAFKVVVTGSGKVAHGAWDILEAAGFKEVNPVDYLHQEYDIPVYTKLGVEELYVNSVNGGFDKADFYKNPENYNSAFLTYSAVSDVLINGIFWKENIVRLFEKEDVKNIAFNINVIADVTCDIDGSVPLNQGASSIADPVYGVDRNTFEKKAAFMATNDIIDIMAVDNLPNELPRDASAHFSEVFKNTIIPELLAPSSKMLENATICEEGQLTERFKYLTDYANS